MPMYFVQHGLSVAEEIDPDRPLSSEGREEVERIADHLRRMGIAEKQVCHSGKTRARQTAELFNDQIGLGRVSELAGMKPNDDPAELAALLDDNTMYVGHLPHMEKLVSLLTAGNEAAEVVRFKNGGVVCIEQTENGFHIEWYVTPSMYTE